MSLKQRPVPLFARSPNLQLAIFKNTSSLKKSARQSCFYKDLPTPVTLLLPTRHRPTTRFGRPQAASSRRRSALRLLGARAADLEPRAADENEFQNGLEAFETCFLQFHMFFSGFNIDMSLACFLHGCDMRFTCFSTCFCKHFS